MSKFAELIVKFKGDTSDIGTSLKTLNGDLAAISRQIGAQTAGFQKFGQTLSDVGGRMALSISAPLAGIGLSAIKAAAGMETAQTAFTTLLRSSSAAQKQLEEIKQFAASTPFEFNEVVDAARRMQALGFAAKDTLPTLRTIGDAVSSLGLGSEGLNRVILAFGQIRSKGVAQAEELNQLAEAGIPAWDALAKKLGVDVATAMKMVSDRAVDSQTAINGLLEFMQGRFAGGMEAQSKTLAGIFSNLKDQINFTLADVGTTLAPIAKDFAQNVVMPMLVQVRALAKEFADLPVPAQRAALGIAAVGVAAGPALFGLGQIIQSASALANLAPLIVRSTGVVVSLAAAFGQQLAPYAAAAGVSVTAVGLAMATVATWDIAQIFKAATAFLALRDATDAMAKAQQSQRDSLDILSMRIKAHGGDVSAVTSAYRSGLISQDEYRKQLLAIASTLNTGAQATSKFEDAAKSLGFKTTKQLSNELKAAKENLSQVYQAFKTGQASAEDYAKAQESVRQINEQLHPSLKKTKEVLEDISKLQGPTTLGQNLSDAFGAIQSQEADRKVQALAQAISDAQSVSADARKTMEDYSNSLLNAGASAESMEQRLKGMLVVLRGAGQIDLRQAATQTVPDFQWEQITAPINDDPFGVDRTRESIGILGKVWKEQQADFRKDQSEQKKAFQEVSTIINDMNRGIAQSIVNWKGFGDVGVSTAKAIGEALLRNVLQKALTPIISSITNLITKIPQIGKLFSGLGSAASSVSKSATSATSSLGSAASAAASGVMGIVGAVGSAVGAVSGIIGNFQMRGMGKDIGLIEVNTRYLLPAIQQVHDRLVQMLPHVEKLDGIYDRINQFAVVGVPAGGGGGGGGWTFNIEGNVYGGPAGLDQLADELIRRIKQRGGL